MRLSERSVAAQACLPVKDSTPSHGTRCWAAGWGVMSDRNPADMLQEVDLLIISDDKCEETEVIFMYKEIFQKSSSDFIQNSIKLKLIIY